MVYFGWCNLDLRGITGLIPALDRQNDRELWKLHCAPSCPDLDHLLSFFLLTLDSDNFSIRQRLTIH